MVEQRMKTSPAPTFGGMKVLFLDSVKHLYHDTLIRSTYLKLSALILYRSFCF